MVKKALVIVPHQDDEINLIGTIMDQMNLAGICVKVLFVTNGDYPPSDVRKRFKETIHVARKMNIQEMFFLGYGDCPDGEHHIFNSGDAVYHSVAGHSETYCVNDLNDYRYSISKVHSKYRIHELQTDMKECILNEKPELIFCVDFDSHPDHRMTTLVFERVIYEILRDTDYRPIILKKFAYAGTWHGEIDYYREPMLPTILSDIQYFPYAPEQSLRFGVLKKNYPVGFWKSKVYKWCKTYKSQKAKEHFFSIVNADSLFFYRDTNNLAIKGNVSVSSGEGRFLNDFRLFDTTVIDRSFVVDSKSIRQYTWIPDVDDNEKSCIFRFPDPISIQSIAFHQSHDKMSSIGCLVIKLNNGYEETVDIEGKLYYLYVLPEKQDNISEVKISISKHFGRDIGFREIEIFDRISEYPWKDTPFTQYVPSEERRKYAMILRKFFQMKSFLEEDLRMNGVMYYIKRLSLKVTNFNNRK